MIQISNYYWKIMHSNTVLQDATIFVTPKNTLITEERTIYEEAMNLQFIEYDSRSNHKELLDSIKELVSLVESERRDIADKISW